MSVLITLFIANAIAHIISYQKLRQSKSPSAKGVLVFIFINAIIALLLWQNLEWSKWLALVFPALGGLALLFTTILKGKGTWVDYLIFILDVVIIVVTVKLFFI